MPSNFGTTPTSTTSLGTNQFPASAVFVPGTAAGNLTAVQGGPASTDANGYTSSPTAMYVPDGNEVTEGAKADIAITDPTTTNSKMSFLKGLVKILANVWDSTHGRLIVDGSQVTQPVSGTITADQGGSWTMQLQVGTSGGSTPYHTVVSSGTNGTNVKSSAGQVYDGSISNTSSSAVYFRFYDNASSPTVGTTTVKRTIQIPGNGTVIFSWPNGLKFTSGIAYGITAAIADNDTTAISAAVSIDFGYV